MITQILRFSSARNSISAREINFGSGGIHLYMPDEIENGQVGYSVAADGSSLVTGGTGAWQQGWIVIGYDTGTGDPLIMDTNDPTLPVLRDFNGQGRWSPVRIANSLDAFLSAVKEFSRLAEGRSTPVELETNPLRQDQIDRFLARISDLDSSEGSLEFWKALLEG